MKQTAIDIRAQLKEAGYPSRSVSVRCRPSYQIHVSAKSPEVNTEKLCATVVDKVLNSSMLKIQQAKKIMGES